MKNEYSIKTNMFTGIIRQKGRIVAIEKGKVMRYGISFSHEGLKIGASVAIDGVCQSVVSLEDAVYFEAIDETLKRSTLGDLKVDQLVNIERSARFGDEIGGHPLSGHVYCRATISKVQNNIYTFTLEKTDYLFEKGFVAIDGMSLTVVDVSKSSFTVHLIPETLKWFTKGVGDLVNIEFDSLTVAAVETVNRCMPT